MVDVETQVQIVRGLGSFAIVGLPDKAVAESRERVRAALSALGVAPPPGRITVNLAPADLAKEGSHFDLPIALALLAAMRAIPGDAAEGYAALGELALDARLRAVPGVLPAAIAANAAGRGLICPGAQGGEAAWASNADVLAADSLLALVNHFKGSQALSPPKPAMPAPPEALHDLRDIKGQETAKRALEVAAAGGHNMLMTGPPGAGKSMLASRLPGILPPLDPAEALEASMIASIAGTLDGCRLIARRPFRDPHFSVSVPALVGGGARARPGEVSLAHLGVLFLDELPEYPRPALEALRQPLESGTVTVARANAHLTYPARVQLVAAMNPCRCGHIDDPARSCGRRAALRRRIPVAHIGAAVRPHRPACRGAGAVRRRPLAAAAGGGFGPGTGAGVRRARRPGGALRERRRRGAARWGADQRGGGRRVAGIGRGARFGRARAVGQGGGPHAAVGARLPPRAQGGAHPGRPGGPGRGVSVHVGEALSYRRVAPGAPGAAPS